MAEEISFGEKKKGDTITIKIPNFVPKGFGKEIKKNPWIGSTFILGVIALILIVVVFAGGSANSNSVSSNEAGENLLKFIKAQTGEDASVTNSEIDGNLYKMNIDFKGQEVPVYVTLDGKYLVEPIPLVSAVDDSPSQPTQPSQPKNIPKSDKPEVELFVMSHCPYGTQTEKGILPVAKLLENKIDFDIKFVYYAMHGETEVREQVNQYCIQEEQEAKYLDYLNCFLGSSSGSAAEAKACRTEVGIDESKLSSCLETTNNEFNVDENLADKTSYLSGRFPLFDIHKEDNEKYDIAGSPTLIINGQEVSSGRDSVSLLNAICGAFTEGNVPAECETELEQVTPGPGFGWESEASGNLAECGF